MIFKKQIGKIVGLIICIPYRILCPSKKPPLDHPSQRTIAIAVYGGLGDAIMMLPALRMLRNSRPKDKVIIYADQKPAHEILIMGGIADQVLLMDTNEYDTSFKRWRFVRSKIRPLRPQVAIRNFLHTRFQDSFETIMTGAKIRIGYPESKWRSIDTVLVKTSADHHRVYDNASLLALIGAKGELAYPKIEISKEDTEYAAGRLGPVNGKLLIGIHPGCKYDDRVRRWPEGKFSQLIDTIHGSHEAEVILFGGRDDGQSIETIMQTAIYKPSLATSQSLGKTAAMIQKCDAFISNDSGLMHLAAALGTPVVGIFGPTSSLKHGPWGGDHQIAISTRLCSPCWIDKRQYCGHAYCVNDITTAEVYSKLELLIRASKSCNRRSIPARKEIYAK